MATANTLIKAGRYEMEAGTYAELQAKRVVAALKKADRETAARMAEIGLKRMRDAEIEADAYACLSPYACLFDPAASVSGEPAANAVAVLVEAAAAPRKETAARMYSPGALRNIFAKIGETTPLGGKVKRAANSKLVCGRNAYHSANAAVGRVEREGYRENELARLQTDSGELRVYYHADGRIATLHLAENDDNDKNRFRFRQWTGKAKKSR